MYQKLLLIIIASFARCVYTQTVLDVEKFRIYPSSVTQTEPVAAVHPLNNQLLFASARTLNIYNAFQSEGVYVSSDGGVNWRGSDTCNGALIYNHGGDPGVVITESGRFILSHIGDAQLFPGIYTHYSTDFGINWSVAATVTNVQTGDKGTIAIDNSATSSFKGKIYLAWTGLLSPFAAVNAFSTDEGVTWSVPQIVNPNPPLRCTGGSVATSRDGRVYICWSGITQTSPFREDFAGFAVSIDGGENWNVQQNIFDMNGISGTLVSKEGIRVNGLPQVEVDKSGGSRDGWIYIVTTEFGIPPAGSDPDIILHRSTDGGVTWSAGIRVNQDPTNNGKIQYFPALEIDDEGGINILFYDDRNTSSDSTDVFLARSIDSGNTWDEFAIKETRFEPKPIAGGASAYQGDHIALLSVGEKLFAFWMADYSGIYQIWFSTIDRSILSIDKKIKSGLNNFTLFQNYPNPFNPSTTISWQLAEESSVTLKIFNAFGEEIETLVHKEYQNAGEHSSLFIVNSSLPSGIYLYQLKAGNFVQTKKMILMK